MTEETITELAPRVVPERDGDLAEQLLRIGRECAVHLSEPYRSMNHGDLLYDDLGLPQ